MQEYIEKEALVLDLDRRHDFLEEMHGGCDQYTMGFLEAVLRVENFLSADAVPVSELEELRDYLYAEDLIFMRGLAKLNKLIANHGGTKTGKTPDKNTKP